MLDPSVSFELKKRKYCASFAYQEISGENAEQKKQACRKFGTELKIRAKLNNMTIL